MFSFKINIFFFIFFQKNSLTRFCTGFELEPLRHAGARVDPTGLCGVPQFAKFIFFPETKVGLVTKLYKLRPTHCKLPVRFIAIVTVGSC